MNPESQRLARELMELCSHDTTTGQEDVGVGAVLGLLEGMGARVVRQEVEPGRSNVLALWGDAPVLLTTHLDTVPPFIPPRLRADHVYGRGSCDAKGQVIAQLGAIGRLLESGERRVAWLGVVGEETDSLGATRAVELAEHLIGCRAVINGEPTELNVASGQKGALHLRLICHGRAAHSSIPELGQNAAWPLLGWLERMRALPVRAHPVLEEETWSLTGLQSGTAPNVIPDRAVADVFARTVPGTTFAEDVRRLAPGEAEVEIAVDTPPLIFASIPGMEQRPVPFGSDAGRVSALAVGGRAVMVGPGSIEVAHTADEHLSVSQLLQGVELLERLVRHFLTDETAAL